METSIFATLSARANLADEHFYATVRAEFGGKEWWAVPDAVLMANAACREAFRAKLAADSALLDLMRS